MAACPQRLDPQPFDFSKLQVDEMDAERGEILWSEHFRSSEENQVSTLICSTGDEAEDVLRGSGVIKAQ